MSGICGLFNLDGAPVVDGELRAMTAIMGSRGPDRTGRWHNACIGFGHTLLATTPELQFEQQPFVEPDSGCVITADVRLDNRDELRDALNLQASPEFIGEAELILRAYLKWGQRCTAQLLGDFAFAIWDPRQQTLFCARDHFGLRSLYYHYDMRNRFVFASSPRGILVLPQVPYRINEGRIADFLVPQLEWIDYTSTFFEDVHRLPPGHEAIVARDKFRIDEYWRPEPGPDSGPMSDDDYREGLIEVLERAVETRLRAPDGAVASMMSGGMDSGSVVAIAKEIIAERGSGPLRTYSATRRDNADCAESRAITAAKLMPSIAPILVHPESLRSNFEACVYGNEEPFDGEMMMLKAIYRIASQDGQTVVLDGAGGDIVLNEGTYVARLLRSGNFRLALREIAANERFWGAAMSPSALLHYLRAAFVPEFLKQPLRRIQFRQWNRKYLGQSLISGAFVERVNVENRFETMHRTFRSRLAADLADERCAAIRPNVTAGRERYARLAAAAGIEPRDPFLDKRMVEYCSRIPGRLLMRDGWPKMILREVMADRLPDDTLWCRGKPHLGHAFNAAVTREALSRGVLTLTELRDSLKGFVDPATLHRAWQLFVDEGNTEAIHSAFLLSVWLHENSQRPVVRHQLIG